MIKIKEIRELQGMRQAELAKKVGIHQSELSAIERGKRRPNVYLAKRIADALQVKVDDLF